MMNENLLRLRTTLERALKHEHDVRRALARLHKEKREPPALPLDPRLEGLRVRVERNLGRRPVTSGRNEQWLEGEATSARDDVEKAARQFLAAVDREARRGARSSPPGPAPTMAPVQGGGRRGHHVPGWAIATGAVLVALAVAGGGTSSNALSVASFVVAMIGVVFAGISARIQYEDRKDRRRDKPEPSEPAETTEPT